MPPQLISLGLFALQQLIQHEPEIAAEIKSLFTKADPTVDDWNALHAKVALKSYQDYVPQTALVLPASAPKPTLTAEVAQVAEQVLVKVLPPIALSQPTIVASGPVTDAPAPKQALNVAPTAVSHSIG